MRVVPLEDFAPVDQIGVPVAAELQPEDPILTARRALAMEQTRAEVESARFEIEDLRRQVTDASAALAATVARSSQLEEVLLEREVEREDLTRRLANLQMKLEQARAREPVQVDASAKEAALKRTLKLERERRHATEVRLRRILGVLRTKLDALPPEEPEEALETTTRRIWRPSSSDSAGFCWNMRPNYAVNSRSWSGPPSWTPRALLCCAKTPKRPSCSPGMAQAAGADAARTSRT